MLSLYHGSGAADFELVGPWHRSRDWERLRNLSIRMLVGKGHLPAAQRLREQPFTLFEATNHFGDEFLVLAYSAPMDTYLRIGESLEDFQVRHDYKAIAEAVSEVCSEYVRFVAVDLETSEGPEPVTSPVLEITSDVVERALQDAERLIATQGATSGVDRLHTAFHGYLRAVATAASLPVAEGAGITELFRIIREAHPGFQRVGARQADVDRAVRALATVVDVLNPVRNLASVAHPNEALLDEPEAMLVINVVRSLLHYLNARTRSL
jgi:hypothetical protein